MSRSYCFFSAQYLPTMGGVERYTYELAKELIARDNKVTVVTSRLKGLPEREVSKEGIAVWRLPCLSLLGGRLPVLLPTPARHRLIKELEKEHFDLVVINTRFYPHSLFGAKFAERVGCPSLVIEHGSAHLTLTGGWIDRLVAGYEHGITALLKRRCRHYFGVSKVCCEWLKHFGIAAQGILYNAVDFDAIERIRQRAAPHFRRDLGIGTDTPIVVYTGRLIEEKGVLRLAEAVTMLADRRAVHLLLAGSGPLLDTLKTVAPHCVTVLGRLSFEEIVTLLCESDIYCLPSQYPEGFPTSYLEAVACRCFAVSMPVAGVSEVLTQGDYGILLSDCSRDAVCDGLERALARSDRVACAQRAYEYCVQRYTFARTADELEAACMRYN